MTATLTRARETDSLLALLRCPATGRPLARDGDGRLRAAEDGPAYDVVDGVPVLLAGPAMALPPHAGAPTGGAPGRLERLAKRVVQAPPSIVRNVGSEENYETLRDLLDGSPARPRRVLVVGGATEGIGIRPLLDAPGLDVVETDVALGPRTQVVCDAANLPFADGSFDAVVTQAVLGVVPDPVRSVAEIHRVLAPGGLVYSETPFLQQAINGAFDFTRWTHTGHRRLFRRFDEVRSGAHGGPGMALAWAVTWFLLAFAGRSRPARAVAKRIGSLLTFWLLAFDRRLVVRPGGVDAASGTYFLGRRREGAPLADAEIVAGYRGAVPGR
jgi:SAM-dependent methyltransferase